MRGKPGTIRVTTRASSAASTRASARPGAAVFEREVGKGTDLRDVRRQDDIGGHERSTNALPWLKPLFCPEAADLSDDLLQPRDIGLCSAIASRLVRCRPVGDDERLT